MIDRATIRSRLLSRIQKDPLTKCWIFTGAWNAKGQARMRVGTKVYTVQRVVAWLMLGIDLWDNCYRYRTCKTPACCNPAHVTAAAGVAEAFKDMRRRRLYSTKGHRKLRPPQKLCIKIQMDRGRSAAAIAADLKMNQATIHRAYRAASA